MNNIIFQLAKTYIFLYYHILYKLFNIPFIGLGRVQQFINKDRILKFTGKKIHYSAKIKGSYDLLLIGKSNEPETHFLFNDIVPKVNDKCNFVDVGASVGEMMVGISIYDNVEHIIGFEPRKDCAEAIIKTSELNNDNRITLFNNAVGSHKLKMNFNYESSGSGSGISKNNCINATVEEVDVVRLDDVLPEILINTIMLIDVEGYELEVLKGAITFIYNNKPLIVFEYNDLSKEYFNLNDISNILSNDYSIYKVTRDGELDINIVDTWNCLAVSSESIFCNIVKDIIIK